MVKRVIFIVVWTVLFYFGSGCLLGLPLLFFLVAQSLPGQHVSKRAAAILLASWVILSMIITIVGLVLGLSGKLPGTRRPSKAQDT